LPQQDQRELEGHVQVFLAEKSFEGCGGLVMTEEIRSGAERERKSVLDSYGATDPAEFFAVATEAFFEKPLKLQQKHPELSQELKNFYRQDPARWPQVGQ